MPERFSSISICSHYTRFDPFRREAGSDVLEPRNARIVWEIRTVIGANIYILGHNLLSSYRGCYVRLSGISTFTMGNRALSPTKFCVNSLLFFLRRIAENFASSNRRKRTVTHEEQKWSYIVPFNDSKRTIYSN